MRMSLHPDLTELAPGEEAELQIAVANDGDTEVAAEVDLSGLDADLWRLENPLPVIPSGQVARAVIRVRLPDDAAPGDRRISVTIRDASGREGASASASLRIGTSDVIAVSTDPQAVSGKRSARFSTLVRNRGDEPLRLRVSGRSDSASVSVEPSEFTLPAGKGAKLRTRVEPTKRSWFRERRHGLIMDARGGTAPATTTTIFVQRPVVPPLLLRMTAVVLALAVWASATVAIFSFMNSDDELAAPAEVDAGDGDGTRPAVLLPGDLPADEDATVQPPVVIVGTVDGPREMEGTRVLIERVAFGDEGTTGGSTGKVVPVAPVASSTGKVLDKVETTTDEKGRFRVASGLAAGAFYRVSALRSGVDVRTVVVSTASETELELALSMTPGRGSMSGRVVDQDGKPIGGATIEATQGVITYRTVTSTADPDGAWTLEGLATPATYLVTVTARGYATQNLTVEVAGGASVGSVDATMQRDLGTIRGRITSQDDGVGAVTVTLEGPEARETTTLTVGDLVGSFDFPNLAFGTYLMTFTADGWLTQSREVEVASGDVPVEVKDLLRSTAEVWGVVAQQVVSGGCEYPDPTGGSSTVASGTCGGVGVSVIGEEGTWSTTTATADGSFRIVGVPAGEYTVAFERYGYLPEFYRIVAGPGDVLTLPDDAEYDVATAAARGPSGRALSPLAVDSVQLRLRRATPLDEGKVTGTIRDATRVDTPLDEILSDWSGACTAATVLVTVTDQPGVKCTLTSGGGFMLTGVAPGAAELNFAVPGLDNLATVVEVAPSGESPAGLIMLTPLATLTLNVTGANSSAVTDAVVFIGAQTTTPDMTLSDDSDDVRKCTVSRKDANDIWKEGASVPSGYTSRTGICANVANTGDVIFSRSLGTGSIDIITPVNGSDPKDDKELATTVPLDHVQGPPRSVDVVAGENVRLDLSLRRYAVVLGTIQQPSATSGGYDNIDSITGSKEFPALDSSNVGVEFCEVDTSSSLQPKPCLAYSAIEPRFSLGTGAGLLAGQYRIDRIPPNEGDTLREYRLKIITSNGTFERSPRLKTAIEALAFNEDRPVSAILAPSEGYITIGVGWRDGSSTEVISNASVTVSGLSDYRTLDSPPYREEVSVTCPSVSCYNGAKGLDGRTYEMSPAALQGDTVFQPSSGQVVINNVFRAGSLTVTSTATGFQDLSSTVTCCSVPAVVNNVAVAAKVATLTTTAAHSFAVGDSVCVAGLEKTDLNGTFTIKGVPTPTTFTYDTTAGDVPSGLDSGKAMNDCVVFMTPEPREVTGTIKVERGATTAILNGMTVTLTPQGGGAALTTGTPGTGTVAGAPTITSVTSEVDGQLSVAFTAPSDTGGAAVTDYQYKLGDSGSWVSVGATTSPFTISSLTDGTEYSVRVRAVTSGVSGAASGPATGIPGKGTGTATFSFLAGVAPGTYSVTVSGPGVFTETLSSTVTVAPGSGTFSIDGELSTAARTVSAGSTTGGTVTDAIDTTEKLKNVRVSVQGSTCSGKLEDATDGCAWTDANGKFSGLILPPGASVLVFEEFSADNTRTTRPTFERVYTATDGDTTKIAVALQPSFGSLFGQVQIANYSGATVDSAAGVTVSATRQGGVATTTKTVEGGGFLFRELVPGSYTLQFSLNGYDTETSTVTVGSGTSTVSQTLIASTMTVTAGVAVGDTSLSASLTHRDGVAMTPIVGTNPSLNAGVVTYRFSGVSPGTWTLSTSGGQKLDPPHLDFSSDDGATFTVTVGTTSFGAVAEFVAVTGTVTSESVSGEAEGKLKDASVTVVDSSPAVTDTTQLDPKGAWEIRVPSRSTERTVSFSASKTGYSTVTTSASVGSASVSGINMNLVGLSSTTVTATVTSTVGVGSTLSGIELTLSSGGTTKTATTDGSGVATFSDVTVGTWTLGVSNSGSTHLAYGPLAADGTDAGTGPRDISVPSETSVSVVLQKRDLDVTASIRKSDDTGVTALTGVTVTATANANDGTTITLTKPLTSTAALSDFALSSDRAWTVTVKKDEYEAVTRSIARGGSGALGGITLASTVRDISGEITGPSGTTVTITASANGYRSTSTTVDLDQDAEAYSFTGLSNDVTWRLDFAVTEGVTTSVSRWVASGSGDVSGLNQTVGTTAVSYITVVVVDTADSGVRSADLAVTLTLSEPNTTFKTLSATGELSQSITLVNGVASASHTFANLIRYSAGVAGNVTAGSATSVPNLAEDRLTLAVSATGYDTVITTLLEPDGSTVRVALVPSERTFAPTITGPSCLSITMSKDGVSYTGSGSGPCSFSVNPRPGDWVLAASGYADTTVTIPLSPASVPTTAAMERITPTTLAITTQPVGGNSGSVLATQPVVAIRDADGDTATALPNSTTVTAAVLTGAGTLSGTTTVTASSGVATFTDLVINGPTASDYRLIFTSTGLTSATSNPISITAAAPGAPTSVSGTAGDTFVDLVWTAPGSNGGSSITDYVVQYSSDSGSSWSTFADGTSSGTSTRVTGLTNGTSYTFQVAAVNAVGTGSYSTASTAVKPGRVPDAPGIASVTPGNTQLVVVFDAPADDGGKAIIDYDVQYSSDSGANWSNFPDPVTTSTATSVTITGLTNGTTYVVRVRAANAAGEGPYSALVSGTPRTTPGAPTSVSGTAGDTFVDVAWTAPSSDGGASITDYVVQVKAGSGSWSTFADGTSSGTSTRVTGLTNGTSYTFQVAAVNAAGAGSYSSASSAVVPGTAAGAPTITSVTAGDGQLSVAFTAPSDTGGATVSDYDYQLNGGSWVPVGATTSPFTISSLTNGTEYLVRVRAVTSEGDGAASGPATGTPRTTPGAPTSVSGTAGDTFVDVAWTAPSSDGGASITDYVVQVKAGSGSWSTFADGTSSGTSTRVTGLTNGTSYTFQVAAVNAAGAGSYSSASSAVVPGTAAGAPTITSVTAGDGQLSVAFTAPSDTGGATVSDYDYQLNGGSWVPVGATTSPFTISSLTNGTEYLVRVRAVTSEGDGAASGPATGTPRTTPGAPTSLSATVGSGQATITFTAGSDGGSSILRYEYELNDSGSWLSAGVVASPVTVTGLTNGTTYSVKIRAVNAAGAGTESIPESVTPEVDGLPTQPRSLAAGTPTATTMPLTWSVPTSDGGESITDYVVQFKLSTASVWTTFADGVSPSTGATVTGLTASTSYDFRVAAVNSVGQGAYTDSVTESTAAS